MEKSNSLIHYIASIDWYVKIRLKKILFTTIFVMYVTKKKAFLMFQ